MNDRQDMEFDEEKSSPRSLVADAKTHRLILTNPNGKVFINMSVFTVVIVSLLAPQLAVIIAIIAMHKGATVEIVSADVMDKTKDKKKKKGQPQSIEEYFEQEHDLEQKMEK